MKSFWMSVAMIGLFSLVSAAQTASGSGSGNASVTPSQVGAGANVSQNAQAAGASANTNTSTQAQVSTDHKPKQESNSKAEAHANAAGNAGAGSAGTSAVLAGGTTVNAELAHSLDAKSAKPGDQVMARVTEDVKANGKVVVHKGSKLVGHVTEAQARGKGSADSRLGIVFDKAVLKSGEEVAFSGAVQALAPPVNAGLLAAADESSNISPAGPGGGGARRSGGGGLLGGATSTATGAVSGATNTVAGTTTAVTNGTVSEATGLAGGLTAQGRLTSASQGAISLQGLTLNSAAASSANGSIISSTTRNVKLESGTQMLVKVAGSAQ